MGKVAWFKSYIESMQSEIETINRAQLVVIKEQLIKFLDDQSSSKNLLLLGIIPDYKGKGDNADEFKLANITQLMVLKKTTFSEYDHDGLVNIYEETLLTMELVVKKILNDSSHCSELSFLNPNSINIVPVYNLASCNGWKLMFNFDMFL